MGFECVSPNKLSPTESQEVFTISVSSNSTLNEPVSDTLPNYCRKKTA